MRGELKATMNDAKLDELHRAAIARLSLKPGTCSRDGCGEMLMACKVEQWDGKGEIPPLRFGCPEHDVWLGFCFDEGYPEDKDYTEGLYEAVLRDPSAPAWRWLPENLRPAAARAGFGVHHPMAYPHVLLGVYDGRTWATDRSNVIAIGGTNVLATVEAEVHGSKRAAARYRLADKHFGAMFGSVDRASATREPVRATEAGHGAMWDRFFAFGEAVVPGWMVSLVQEVYPGCSWRSAGRLDPVVASLDGRVVAIAMPVDTIELERIAREEVCRARHDATNGNVELSYSCNLPPEHDGPIHEIRVRGRVSFRWDEREHPRTDGATSSAQEAASCSAN